MSMTFFNTIIKTTCNIHKGNISNILASMPCPFSKPDVADFLGFIPTAFFTDFTGAELLTLDPVLDTIF